MNIRYFEWILLKIIILTTIAAVIVAPANAEKVSIGNATVSPGKTATVAIQVTGITTDIATFTIGLTFNPQVVIIRSISAGDLGSPGTNIDNASGTAIISIFSLTPVTASTAILARAVLQGNSTAPIGATSPLTLSVDVLTDLNGNNRVPGSDGITGGVVTISDIIKGDVNEDGQVTVVDALFIAQFTVGTRTLTPTQLAAADVNADGQVTIVDALFIAQFTVGLRQQL